MAGPKVTVEHRDGRSYATCKTGDCKWTYDNSVKTDVQWHAKCHRDHHRREAR
jgi:hypothetical protein